MTMAMMMAMAMSAGDFERLQGLSNIVRLSASVGSEKLPSTYMVMFWRKRNSSTALCTVCHDTTRGSRVYGNEKNSLAVRVVVEG